MQQSTSIKIIDNKKLALTVAEFKLYQDICLAYDRPNFKGADLFIGLFETDDRGLITFICPPATRYTSMEAWLYIGGIAIHQHIRNMYDEMHFFMAEAQKKIDSLTAPK